MKIIGCILITLPFAALGIWLFTIIAERLDDIESFLEDSETPFIIKVILYPIVVVFIYLLMPLIPVFFSVAGWLIAEWILKL